MFLLAEGPDIVCLHICGLGVFFQMEDFSQLNAKVLGFDISPGAC